VVSALWPVQLCSRLGGWQVVRATPNGSAGLATVSVLVGLAWLLQLLDGITAVQMMQARGTATELNPLIQSAFLHMGIVGVAAVKAAVIGPLAILFSRLARRGQLRLARLGLLVAGLLGLVGCVSNLVTRGALS
jgi:hypothetical protein